MHQVLLYLLRSSKPLVPEEEIADMLQWEELEWQKYAEECKGMIVTNPGMVRPQQRPCLPLQGHSPPPSFSCFLSCATSPIIPKGVGCHRRRSGPQLLCRDEVG